MATYVNNLRLKEIATGDESGTWGTSTNTNLELIADAFGYSTEQLAANADETFTMTDGTADGVRAMYLKLTSAVSLSATRTVTLAPNTVSKVWIIENATTGSQSITISQGSGSTVTIANGAKAMVYTDGAGATAAVVLANPTILLASGVTGILPTANGGTGITSFGTGVATWLGTPSSANLAAAVTDETGSGVLVFGTAPTVSGPTINDGYTEEVYAIPSSTTPALSPTNGSIQTWTLTGNSTPTAGTWASGQSMTLMIDDGTAYTVDWSSVAVTWKTDSGVAPTLNTSGYTVIALWKVSTTIYGARVGNA